MMKKKKLLILLCTLIPLFIMTISATWIILSQTVFAPSYNPDSNSILFNAYANQDPVYYNGSEQGPTSKNSKISDSDVTFKYRKSGSNSFYSKGLPINAGTYDILISDNTNTYMNDVVQFTINKAIPVLDSEIQLSANSIYEDENVLLLNPDQIDFINQINETTTLIIAGETTLSEILFLDSYSNANDNPVDIKIKFTPDDTNNYEETIITISNLLNIKCVAYINSTYYGSIEKALNAAVNGNIVCLIPATLPNYHDTNNKVTPDKVVYNVYNDCEIKEGVSLVIPTDQSTLSTVKDSSTLNTYIKSMQEDDRSRGSSSSYSNFATASESNYLRTTVILNDGITLTNNGNLIVSGYLSGGISGASTMGQTSHSYSRILLGNSTQIIQNNTNAKIYCFGYIQEKTVNNSSQVIVDNGILYIPFIVDDYKGFQFSWAMTDGAIDNERCSPFNQFEMRNIDSNVQINYNAIVYGIINVYVTYSTLNVDQVFSKTLNILGNSDSFFFQFSDSAYSSVNYKFDRTTAISKVKAYGGLKLNNFQLELKATGLTVNLSTTNAFFPFSYRFDIELFACEGQSIANFDVTSQRIKLLPGASLTINDNCLLKANELVIYSAFYDGTIGNGQNSQIGSSKAYPLKKGATLKVLNNGRIESNSLAGTIYGNNANITYTSDSIISKEAWSIGSSGKLTPAWNIKDYLEIREKLNICPLNYLDTKVKLYVGMNTFTNYNSYLPALNVWVNNGSEVVNVNIFQEVLFFDTLNDYQFEFVSNIYKAFYNSKLYTKSEKVTYNDNNSIIGVINSVLSISNNNNGINEFNVQEVRINCITPPVNGQIPLYIDSTISLEAEVDDITKSYSKTITWKSLDTSIATVDNNGKVKGVALGKTIIQAICDGVIGEFEVEVIEEIAVDEIESIYITDNSGNSSEKVAGSDTFGGSTSSDYHGAYANNKQIVFTININPSSAPYSSIEWTFNASAAGRQYMNDSTQAINKENNVTSVTINTVSGTGASADKATLNCVVTGLNSQKYTATFVLKHNADTVCIVEETLISMADGTQKKVEDLKVGDSVLVFNHATGQLDVSQIVVNVHESQKAVECSVINLIFNNGQKTRISFEHGFFDVDLNEYVYINESNYQSMIGHRFYMIDGSAGILTDAYITNEVVRVYSPVTYKHLNIFSDNLLSIGGDLRGLFNIFELDEEMKINIEKMNEDIEKYGLFTYDEWDEYLSYEQFIAFNVKYLKVSIGKGLVTKEEIIRYIESYL